MLCASVCKRQADRKRDSEREAGTEMLLFLWLYFKRKEDDINSQPDALFLFLPFLNTFTYLKCLILNNLSAMSPVAGVCGGHVNQDGLTLSLAFPQLLGALVAKT